MQNIDLHNHSRVSDGLLSPAELVALAASNGVTGLALTDHDDLAGLPEARVAAFQHGLGFVTGVEISVTWNQMTLHILGLAVDEQYTPLQQGLARLRQGRQERAERMAFDLARAGIAGALEGARHHAQQSAILARTHFARYLVEKGVARDIQGVFKRYLVKGKPGYVVHHWAMLGEALSWILGAGGIPVIAHPGRYALKPGQMARLLDEFTDLGGRAIEVATANHTPEQRERFAGLALRHGLMASRGGDYHGPGESWTEPGRIAPLPPGLTPVWEDARMRAQLMCYSGSC
ncbi:MAG: PHP domain-containing protein [Betaproteobacteria bacterium]|jgi:Predicted metal-dependent phosphoesterases (PHP family)|nr:PHP domain-containing protein [Betaproteobacteria bacterium]